jgi:hypothetical protein
MYLPQSHTTASAMQVRLFLYIWWCQGMLLESTHQGFHWEVYHPCSPLPIACTMTKYISCTHIYYNLI